MLKLDHIALGTNDLVASSKTLSESLGVLPFGGGEHELFGTHNKLWRIEAAHYPIYMELIAINPKAQPQRPRWFGLERPFVGDDIQLLGFIASTQDIDGLVQKPPFDGLELIDVARGDLKWRFGITQDGSLLGDGALPYLIEWQGGRHPLDNAREQNIELRRLSGQALAELEADWPCKVDHDVRHKFGVELGLPNGERLSFTRD